MVLGRNLQQGDLVLLSTAKAGACLRVNAQQGELFEEIHRMLSLLWRVDQVYFSFKSHHGQFVHRRFINRSLYGNHRRQL